MDTENSSNGYCNLIFIGKPGVGKTFLINNIFKNKADHRDFTLVNNDQDILISDNYHQVKTHIQEIHSIDKDNYNVFGDSNSKARTIFILVIYPLEDKSLKYEKDSINTIKNLFKNSILLIYINGKIDSKTQNNLLKIDKTIRDIFFISNFNDNTFLNFRNTLKNIIINFSTNRLNSVKNKIHTNFLTKEKYLDIGNCNLTSFYEVPELFDCIHLETLILSNEWAEFIDGKWKPIRSKNSNKNRNNNNIGIIPKEIKNLTVLKKIILGGDWKKDEKNWQRGRIIDISPLIKLTNLEYLNLSNNNIKNIPNLSGLQNLRALHLNNNEIETISLNGKLNSLTEFYLSNNLIKSISFFNRIEIPYISTIDLHGNEIKDLEPIKKLIDKLSISNTSWEQKTINVAKNPLEKPPIEIINTGKNAVLNYFEDLLIGKVYINKDVKIILVGNSEVGKTTLSKYLDDEKDLDIEHSSTHWMDEKQITSKHILSKIKQKCTINLFDFGGHDYFHDTHHLFYSSNTIYLLLWDKNSNNLDLRQTNQKNTKGEIVEVQFQDYPLKYWLDSIEHFIKDNETDTFDFETNKSNNYNSDVLVIQNKVDSPKKIEFLNNEKLNEDYPFIYDFINICIKDNRRNLLYFDSILVELLNNTPIIGAKLPNYYGKIKESLSNYKGNPILNLNDFQMYCNSISSVHITLEQAKYLASYLKQVGLILYYPTSTNNDKIYIDKKWVIDKIYKILEGLTAKKGEFEINYLDAIFKNSLNKTEKENIIKLMIDFKIIFIHPISNQYIAPLYLPLKPLKIISLFLDEDITPYRRFIYKGFIHKNIILNLFQEYGKLVVNDNSAQGNFYYYWRDGLIIKDKETNEIVKIQFYLGDNDGNAHIDLFKLNNKNKTDFVFEIIKYIHKINKDYEIEETVTIDDVDYISYELLNKNAKQGKLIFTEKSLKEKSNNQVDRKVFELKKYKMFIEEGIKKKKVVISYSKKDLERVHTFIRYMQPLMDLDLIERPWYCTLINPADEWDEKIQSQFNEADIIFFMVSEYFYSTNYIVEKEIKSAIDRYDKDKSVKIVPIILEHYEWARKTPYNLQRFSALPFQAKPISDFKNEKLAWSTITTSVKQMIEKDLDPGQIDIISRDLQEIYERQVKGKLDNNSN